MAKTNSEIKTIFELLSNSDFLIPKYKRPYIWGEEECQKLWDNIYSFAFPNGDRDRFKEDKDVCFLGSIVAFKNADKKNEIIDGEQRLITIMLLLRVLYIVLRDNEDKNSMGACKDIEKCIWKSYKSGRVYKGKLKINSVADSDNDKEDLLSILKTKQPNNSKSKYAKNKQFFYKKSIEFISIHKKDDEPCFANRILKNCIIDLIEVEPDDTMLKKAD